MEDTWIRIKGARVHNLKNISLDIPRNQLVVITGLSGSGKSSLAFDTIYSEGQRRYLESLSSYVRQFIGEMKKPDVDSIEGLSPTIAITQHSGSRNPRSTVGTMTEIYDYMRLLYARIGIPHCPNCGKEIRRQSVDQMMDIILGQYSEMLIQVLSPVVREKKGEFKNLLEEFRRKGFVRVMINEVTYDLDDTIELKKTEKHSISVVVDRMKVTLSDRTRMVDSIEQAIKMSSGLVEILVQNEKDGWVRHLFSETYSCPDCSISISELEPRVFSFNSPFGACPVCSGLGVINEVSPDLVVPRPELSLFSGAILVPGFRNMQDSYTLQWLEKVLKRYKESVQTPFNKLSKQVQKVVLHGDDHFEGVIPIVERRYKETDSEMMRYEYEKLMIKNKCPACHGSRLKPESLSVTIDGKNIQDLTVLSLRLLKLYFNDLKLTDTEKMIGERVIKEIVGRLQFIIDVGLEYLSLSRDSASLSGGEAQRLRLASQVGSGLVGVLYVLDEPSIGLHPKDNEKLLATLCHLRDLGNSVIVVEHDEETIRSADFIVDVGLGAGRNGGEIIAKGTLTDILKNKVSLTAKFLNGTDFIKTPTLRRKGNGKEITLKGVSEHNLQKVDARFPLGTLICITGVSGSGKSTLIHDVLYKALSQKINKSNIQPGDYKSLSGVEELTRVIIVDQSPIGRTPRSNPATYIGLWTEIRDIFSTLPESKMRGYNQGRFSFNVKGGRCETCQGDGVKKVEMQFLPDVFVPCEVCEGRRFNRETLEIKYKSHSIADILDMTITEALELFGKFPVAGRKLQLLADVGLDYIKLGQSSTTLSGGEAQRIKLALELSKRLDGKTLYILDEPTTGLHFADIKKLMDVLNRLVESSNTVIVIEHNLDVIKCSDYIIDLGPGGGEFGGKVIAVGTPEEVSKNSKSYTGHYLKKLFHKES